MNNNNIYCTRFKVTLNYGASSKHKSLCSRSRLNWSEQPLFKGHPGPLQRCFDTVPSLPDFIEVKTKTEQIAKYGKITKSEQPALTQDSVSDNQNSMPSFTDEVASNLSAIKSKTVLITE
jgi:hypothetical protein